MRKRRLTSQLKTNCAIPGKVQNGILASQLKTYFRCEDYCEIKTNYIAKELVHTEPD